VNPQKQLTLGTLVHTQRTVGSAFLRDQDGPLMDYSRHAHQLVIALSYSERDP